MRGRLHRLPAAIRYWRSVLRDRLLNRAGATAEIRFRCNICGRPSRAPQARLSREVPSCRCGSTVRQRALIHVLTTELFGSSKAIPDLSHHSDIVGLDMSGAAVYADRLSEKLSFTNTFLHKAPRLDITTPGEAWQSQCDFVISSDVFEHVAPPVSAAFENTLQLLKPGGVLVITVPYAPTGDTVEHFPELHDYRIEKRDGNRVLVNRTADGRAQVFDKLVFHGGAGDTLELRVFSQSGLIQALDDAGFTDIRIHGDAFPAHGIFWPEPWSLPVSARRPTV